MIRIVLVATFVAVLVAIASGCGASSSDEDVASLDGGTATTDESAIPVNADDDPQEAALKWARCMRKHGVDVPDPDFSNGRFSLRAGRGALRDGNPEQFEQARKACGNPLANAGPPQLSEENRQELQEAMLAFARCMRENGVDMPDPSLSGGGALVRVGRGDVDPDDPTFRKAQAACQPILRRMEEKLGIGRARP